MTLISTHRRFKLPGGLQRLGWEYECSRCGWTLKTFDEIYDRCPECAAEGKVLAQAEPKSKEETPATITGSASSS